MGGRRWEGGGCGFCVMGRGFACGMGCVCEGREVGGLGRYVWMEFL